MNHLMKKLISFSLMALLCSGAFSQDINSREGQTDKKSIDNNNKVKEAVKKNTLDGRSFKVSFTERQAEVKPVSQTGAPITNDSKTIEKPVSDYSVFDANSKVMFTFSDQKILSPVLASDGCPYRTNVSGNEMYAFSSYCRLNTGNRKVDHEVSAQDTKMKIDAANSTQPVSAEQGAADITAPVTTPPDETKQHLPPGVARDDNAGLNTPPAGNESPTIQRKDIQRQDESPLNNSGYMAAISGVVNGNAIQGVITWTESDGRKISYAFSGSAATKKDMNDTQVVGMK
jgi:hypothetical protein